MSGFKRRAASAAESSTARTLYDVLEIPQTAAGTEVRSAFRRKALATHPDKGGNIEQFHECVHAYQLLSCTIDRAAYDEQLRHFSLRRTFAPSQAKVRKFNQHNVTQQPQQQQATRQHQQSKCLYRGRDRFTGAAAGSTTRSCGQQRVGKKSLRRLCGAVRALPRDLRWTAFESMTLQVRKVLCVFMEEQRSTQVPAYRTACPFDRHVPKSAAESKPRVEVIAETSYNTRRAKLKATALLSTQALAQRREAIHQRRLLARATRAAQAVQRALD